MKTGGERCRGVWRDTIAQTSQDDAKEQWGQPPGEGSWLRGGIVLALTGGGVFWAVGMVLPGMGLVGGALAYLLGRQLARHTCLRLRAGERARFREHLAALQRIQEGLVRQVPLPEVLDGVLALIERRLPHSLGAILLCDDRAARFERGFATSLPVGFQAFLAERSVAAAVCPAGQAGEQRESLEVVDLAAETRWPAFRQLALAHGFAGVACCPILATDGRLLGVLTLLHRRSGAADRDSAALVGYLRSLLVLALERHVEQTEQQQRLAYQATHDALTGLGNRALLEDRLAHDLALAVRHGQQLAVLFIGLDEFKPINDALGHGVGDQLLIQAARRLAVALRPSDTLVRFAGDEFVVVLPDLRHRRQAMRIAERLRETLAQPYRVAARELHLSASIGVALSGEGEGEGGPEALLQQADMAMAKAKQLGGGACEPFTPELTERLISRLTLRHELQAAIDAQQFELHYQPLIGQAGSVVGLEALVRWEHPVRGTISPGLFIPLAEETGQIIPLSRWILERACRDFRALMDQGLEGCRVAINLSPLQVHGEGFLAELTQTLERTGLPARALELELTERVLLDDTEVVLDTLRALRGMQVSVALDDFGTGFSSLSYLRHLPIDRLKIDRSFVAQVTDDPKDAAVVRGIVNLAHELSLDVVAEGIETAEQHACLARLGCDVFQGYRFARPMPREALQQWLAEPRDQA